jgi:hypothetical protein
MDEKGPVRADASFSIAVLELSQHEVAADQGR